MPISQTFELGRVVPMEDLVYGAKLLLNPLYNGEAPVYSDDRRVGNIGVHSIFFPAWGPPSIMAENLPDSMESKFKTYLDNMRNGRHYQK